MHRLVGSIPVIGFEFGQLKVLNFGSKLAKIFDEFCQIRRTQSSVQISLSGVDEYHAFQLSPFP